MMILHEFPAVDAIKIKNGQWDAGKKVVNERKYCPPGE